MTTHRITIDVIIQDPEALALAAEAIEDGMQIDSISADGPHHQDGSVNVQACLELIFDPGQFHSAGLYMVSFSSSAKP